MGLSCLQIDAANWIYSTAETSGWVPARDPLNFRFGPQNTEV